MKKLKQKIIRLFFCFELCVFGVLFLWGSHGLPAIMQLKKENMIVMQEITVLEQEVHDLEDRLKQWNADPFYKEQIARELLQMAKKDEIIYFVS